MSAATCPNGHTSGDREWCDTCGAPMASTSTPASASLPGGPAVSVSPVSPAGPITCPHCAAVNAADNLFCESCGYDFVTGQVPEPTVLLAVTPDPALATAAPTWIVVVEVDPVWYSVKGELADRPLPPSSTSTVGLTQHASLIGRSSQSRGLRPEVALDTDTAVSRRHAQLIIEGDQLSVVDLSSTNGTHVVKAGVTVSAALAPLGSGAPVVLGDGDQIFVGAWSRLTVRRA